MNESDDTLLYLPWRRFLLHWSLPRLAGIGQKWKDKFFLKNNKRHLDLEAFFCYNFYMQRTLIKDLKKNIGKKVKISGWIHKIRSLGGIHFVILRDRTGVIQTLTESKNIESLKIETVISIIGKVREEKRAPGGIEVQIEKIEILSTAEDLPLEINNPELKANLDTILDLRPLALRNLKQKAIFKVQAEIVKSFREFFQEEGFVEIQTPKIVSQGAEGGAELFEVKYFNKKAYLAQSPQFYKQMMVGVFEKVFEINPAYRAEIHNTSRHLNEFISLDTEMGFINGMEDVMDVLENFLKKLINDLQKQKLEINIPLIPKRIPHLKLIEVQQILEKSFKEKCLGAPDLNPKQEKLISEYAKEKFKSDFLFITHYPSKKRPFYVMDDPKNPGLTLSFDILLRGLEIGTGGQRLHLYKDYLTKIKSFNLNPKDFDFYLMSFKYGMPPHGGFGLGLERLTMKMMELENVRFASLFPRDISRLVP